MVAVSTPNDITIRGHFITGIPHTGGPVGDQITARNRYIVRQDLNGRYEVVNMRGIRMVGTRYIAVEAAEAAALAAMNEFDATFSGTREAVQELFELTGLGA